MTGVTAVAAPAAEAAAAARKQGEKEIKTGRSAVANPGTLSGFKPYKLVTYLLL